MEKEVTTARQLRERLKEDIKTLQEACQHEKQSDWMPYEWAPGHRNGEVIVCEICDKILKSKADEGMSTLSITEMPSVEYMLMQTPESINSHIDSQKKYGLDTSLISDGYHTFGELYEHRIELFIALCKRNINVAWKSKIHSDGSAMEGWFIMGLYQEKGFQISYHIPDSYWHRCAFLLTLPKAPEFDGHSSEDVVKRLREL